MQFYLHENLEYKKSDTYFAQAVVDKNYPLVTKLIHDNIIDPNEIIDARKRLYPDYETNKALPIWRVDYTCFINQYSWDKSPEFEIKLEQDVRENAKAEFCTILHEAIACQNEALVSAILASKKTNPNQKSERGYTPLHYAVILGNELIIQKLIARGADISLTCNGYTPADFTQKESLKTLLKPSLKQHLLHLPIYILQAFSATPKTVKAQITAGRAGYNQYGILAKCVLYQQWGKCPMQQAKVYVTE